MNLHIVWLLVILIMNGSAARRVVLESLISKGSGSPVGRREGISIAAQYKSILSLRGGGDAVKGDMGDIIAATGPDSNKKVPMGKAIAKRLLGMWGVLQVVSIIGNAIRRVLPIAMQPFEDGGMKSYEWVMYVTWSVYMLYMEGYKAFQCKFSPLVAERAFRLIDHASPLNILLAGPYSMGMMDATKKRKYISWGVTLGVFGIVKIVKMLPYPYRSIVDGGVVAGLSYGTASILWFAGKALLGHTIDIDPDFPEKKKA